ncbi:MAG: hypothetical protein HRU27_17980 [Rhizobiaceae bacterium]|nr:hypothetical protein [Hyphomicrobiales bacterium]NRB32482.1 hypothetical protein [Rhizobiaceae bacterium]
MTGICSFNGSQLRLWLAILVFVSALSAPLQAREFRQVKRIPSPQLLSVGEVANLPSLPGAQVDGMIPIPERDVKRALEKVLNDWGKPGFRGRLSWHFVRGDELADTVRSYVPRDARIRVLGVSSTQINAQAILRGQAPDGRDLLVSRITTTGRTLVQFNDRSSRQLSSLQGTNDFVLQLFHAIERIK